jgi:hypothetical protein
MLPLMPTQLFNGTGNIYLALEYDAENGWVYSRWSGRLSYINVVAGAEATLLPLAENACAYLLNDNRQVEGDWNEPVDWLISDWAARAIAQGTTHVALVVSPEVMAARSAEMLCCGLSGRVQMRLFSNLPEAEAWLRQAQEPATRSARVGWPLLQPDWLRETGLKYA